MLGLRAAPEPVNAQELSRVVLEREGTGSRTSAGSSPKSADLAHTSATASGFGDFPSTFTNPYSVPRAAASWIVPEYRMTSVNRDGMGYGPSIERHSE
jgi:hypothetical protein